MLLFELGRNKKKQTNKNVKLFEWACFVETDLACSEVFMPLVTS